MTVSLSREGDIGVVLIDNPPVNAASHAVRAGLVEALAEANRDAGHPRRPSSPVRAGPSWRARTSTSSARRPSRRS